VTPGVGLPRKQTAAAGRRAGSVQKDKAGEPFERVSRFFNVGNSHALTRSLILLCRTHPHPTNPPHLIQEHSLQRILRTTKMIKAKQRLAEEQAAAAAQASGAYLPPPSPAGARPSAPATPSYQQQQQHASSASASASASAAGGAGGNSSSSGSSSGNSNGNAAPVAQRADGAPAMELEHAIGFAGGVLGGLALHPNGRHFVTAVGGCVGAVCASVRPFGGVSVYVPL
jgi:hypothetical protein